MEGHWGQVALGNNSLGDLSSSRQEVPHGFTEHQQVQVVRQDRSGQPTTVQLEPSGGIQDTDVGGAHHGQVGGVADGNSQHQPQSMQPVDHALVSANGTEPPAPPAGSMALQVGQVVYPGDQQQEQPMFGNTRQDQQGLSNGLDQMHRLQGHAGVHTEQGAYAFVKTEQQQGTLLKDAQQQEFLSNNSQALQHDVGAQAQQQPAQDMQMMQQPVDLQAQQQMLYRPQQQHPPVQAVPMPQVQEQSLLSSKPSQQQQLDPSVHVSQQQVQPQVQQQSVPQQQQQVAPAQQLLEQGGLQMQQPMGMHLQQPQFMGLQQAQQQQGQLQQTAAHQQSQQPPRPRRTVYSSLQSLGSDVHIASPSLPVVKHRSKKHNTITLSPAHLIHVPRTFLQEHYDIDAVLKNGLKVQIDADGTLDPDVVHASVANYQNKSGYSYHRLLNFKPVCRKYMDWRVVGWQAIDHETVRLCISKPAPVASLAQPAATGAATESSEQEGGDPSRPAKMQKKAGKTPTGPVGSNAPGGNMSGGWMPGAMQIHADMGGGFANSNHVQGEVEDGTMMYNMSTNHMDGSNTNHNSSHAGGSSNNSLLLSTVPLQPMGGGMYATWAAPDQLQGEQLQHMLQQVLQQQDWSQQMQPQQQQALGLQLQPQQQQAAAANQEVQMAHGQAVGPYQILDQAGMQQLLAQHLPGQQMNNCMRQPMLLESLKQQQGTTVNLLSQPASRASNSNAQVQLLSGRTLDDMNQLQPQQQFQQAFNQQGQHQQLLPAPGTACLARSSSGAPIVLTHTSEGVMALPLVQPGSSSPMQPTTTVPQLHQVQQVQQLPPVQQMQYQPGPGTFQLLDSNANALQQQVQHPQQQVNQQQQQQQAMLATSLQQSMQQQPMQQQTMQQQTMQQAAQQQPQQQQQQQPTAVLVVGPNANLMGQVGHSPGGQMQQVQLQGGTPQMLSHQGTSTYSLAFSGYPTGTTTTMHMQHTGQAAPLQAAAPAGALQLRVTQPGNTLLLAQTQPTGGNQPSGYDVIYRLPAQQPQ